jgi:hypothetical protein
MGKGIAVQTVAYLVIAAVIIIFLVPILIRSAGAVWDKILQGVGIIKPPSSLEKAILCSYYRCTEGCVHSTKEGGENMISYIETIRNARSKFLLNRGEEICYDWYRFPDGAKWIVRYGNRFYKISHDGTGNEFFCSHAPSEITKEQAQKILSNYPKAWEEARELGWWEISLDEYFERELS